MPVPTILCAGISHRTAPLELREQFRMEPGAFYERRTPGGDSPILELVLLSTCNRLELYAAVDTDGIGGEAAAGDAVVALLLAAGCDSCAGRREHWLYVLTREDASRHLLEVAAGLDSQVLGEAQILGQVASAHSAALSAGALGPYLSALFQAAIRAGKRARSETALGRNPVSLSSAAISAGRSIFPDLEQRRVLVIGAGEMAQLAVKALLARGARQISVANRTRAAAEALAREASGAAFGLDELPSALRAADVVISATRAPGAVIDRAMLEAAARPGGERLLLIDLALPRDVDPAVRDLPGVVVLDMDDLKQKLDDSLAQRRAEIPHVLAIVEEEDAAFREAMLRFEVQPVISGMRQKAETIRRRELDRALHQLGAVDEDLWRQLDIFSRSLVNKLLHEPTIRLKEKSSTGEVETYVKTIQDLFGLGTEHVDA